MEKAVRFTEHLFWAIIWILLILVVAFAVLGFFQSRFAGSIVGDAADWVASHAQPQS